MSNQEQQQQEQGKLSKEEQDEMKALQDLRKGAGQGGTTFSDSQRVRLTELQQKAEPPEKKSKETAAAAAESKSATGKK